MESNMHTITIEVNDSEVDKFYWLLDHFKDQAKIVSDEPIETPEDLRAYRLAKKEQEDGETVSFEDLKKIRFEQQCIK